MKAVYGSTNNDTYNDKLVIMYDEVTDAINAKKEYDELKELEATLNDWWYDYSDEATEKWCRWHELKVAQDREWLSK